MSFAACAAGDDGSVRRALKTNMERILPLLEGLKRIFVLQVDDLALEPRPGYDHRHNEVSLLQCPLQSMNLSVELE